MDKFVIVRNDEDNEEILVRILDEHEVEAWKILMLQDIGDVTTCPQCGADINIDQFEPLIWTPRKPFEMPLPFNVCHLRCPFCHATMSEEYVVYGEPFESIDHLDEKINSGEIDGTPLEV